MSVYLLNIALIFIWAFFLLKYKPSKNKKKSILCDCLCSVGNFIRTQRNDCRSGYNRIPQKLLQDRPHIMAQNFCQCICLYRRSGNKGPRLCAFCKDISSFFHELPSVPCIYSSSVYDTDGDMDLQEFFYAVPQLYYFFDAVLFVLCGYRYKANNSNIACCFYRI